MTMSLREQGLIVNDRVEDYDGTTAVVRTKELSPSQIEFMRWRAERWIKLRHMPVVFAHNPWFIARNAFKMFRHTFRGCSFKTLMGLEDEHRAFERYRSLRTRERVYI